VHLGERVGPFRRYPQCFGWLVLVNLDRRFSSCQNGRGMGWPFSHSRRHTEGVTSESNIAKISISGDMAGLIVTLVMSAILLTLGATRWFLLASLPVGVAVAVLLRLTARDR